MEWQTILEGFNDETGAFHSFSKLKAIDIDTQNDIAYMLMTTWSPTYGL